MDAIQHENIEYYDSCDNLPMYNWIKIKKTEDLSWLLVGYSKAKKNAVLPIELGCVWEEILTEYEEVTRSDKTEDYYETVIDISEAQKRVAIASLLLSRVEIKQHNKEIFNGYVKELNGWGIHFNVKEPIETSIKKAERQIKAAQMKINTMMKEKQSHENGTKVNKTPILKIKGRVENIIKRHLNFKELSVSEWFYILQDLSTNKKSA